MKESESVIRSIASDSLQPRGRSIEFSRQEYWSGLPFSSLGDLSGPETEPVFPVSPTLQGDSLPLSYQGGPYNDMNPINSSSPYIS